MKDKQRFSFAFSLALALSLSSCGERQNPMGSLESPADDVSCASKSESEGVPKKYFYPFSPDGAEAFDINKSYLGVDYHSFGGMALHYNFCPLFSPCLFEKVQYRFLRSNGRTFSFRYGDNDIFALTDHSTIREYSINKSKRLTLSEAREDGFFDHRKTDSWDVVFRIRPVCKSTETFWVSEKKSELSINDENYFSNIQKYGARDAMMVFLDLGAENDGWPNGISSSLWGAIPIYSDDYSEVVGVSVLNENYEFHTYMKEDGYADKITLDQYSRGIREGKESQKNFGRAAFYFEPSEFVSPGATAYYNLLGGEVDAE